MNCFSVSRYCNNSQWYSGDRFMKVTSVVYSSHGGLHHIYETLVTVFHLYVMHNTVNEILARYKS